jgi:hypothetical protein
MFPHSTIDYFPPHLGFVKLSGTVEPNPAYDFADLAVMPFVWRFAPIHGGNQDHGWRRASRHDRYGLDDNGRWALTDVRPGVQYAVFVVGAAQFQEPHIPGRMFKELIYDEPGALPRGGLSLPEFTHRKYGVHIGSVPADHLTGAVLGVGRATWDEPGPEGHAHLPFRMAAWATKSAGTYFVGETWCEPNGYWTFGDLDPAIKTANTFTVALVTGDFGAPPVGTPSSIPPLGPDVMGIASHPHEPLRTHGTGDPPRQP